MATTEPPNLDRYEILGEIARGGMGVVYRVHDIELDRVLAMKVLSSSRRAHTKSDQSDYYARFLEEVQVTANLDHPSIVPVHDLGFEEDGTPFYTMRFVKGRHLGDIIDLAQKEKEGWHLSRLIDVLVKVCQALAHAHAKGVLHRDLKPANIMVGDLGEVYVMDWGLASMLGNESARDLRIQLGDEQPSEMISKAREGDAATSLDAPLLTIDGGVIGTPAYMPPEQAEGRIDDIDQVSDVYALGAILYQMLAGHPPYMPTHSTVTAREVLTELRNRAPERVRRLDLKLPPELVAVCEKAMAREQTDRYTSAFSLAEDLQAYLNGRVVRAHQTGALVEFRKWVLRNKAVATLGGISILGLAVFTGLLLFSNKELNRTTIQLEGSLQEGELARDQAIHRLATMYTSQGINEDNHSRAALWFSAAANLQSGDQEALLASRTRIRTWLDRAYTPLRAFRLGKGWNDSNIRGLAFHPKLPLLIVEVPEQAAVWDLREEERPLFPNESLRCAAWNPIHGTLATASTQGELILRASPNFEVIERIELPTRPITRLQFSTDGNLLGIGDDSLRLWDVRGRRWLGPQRPHKAPIRWIAFDPEAQHVVTSSGNEARLYAVHGESDDPMYAPFPHYRWLSHFKRPFEPGFDGNGALWTNGGELAEWEDAYKAGDYRLRRWDVASGIEVASLPVHPQRWHPEAGWLFGGQGVLDLEGRERVTLQGDRYVERGAFHPDGGSLLGWKDFGTITNLHDGTIQATIGEGFHDGAVVRALAYAPHGRYAAVALLRQKEDPEVLVFRSWQVPPFATTPTPTERTVVLSPDGKKVAFLGAIPNSGRGGEMHPQVFDAQTWNPLGEPFDNGGTLLAGAFVNEEHLLLGTGLPSDKRAGDGYTSGWVQLWDWKRGQPVSARLRLPSEPRHVARAPDGTWCAVLCAGRELVHVDSSAQRVNVISTGSDEAHRLRLPVRVMDEFVITFLEDGTLVYAGSDEAHHVWTPEARLLQEEPRVIARKRTMTYKREETGRALFVSDRLDELVTAFDKQTWEVIPSAISAASGISALVWDPLNGHLFTGTAAGFGKIWAQPTGSKAELLVQREHPTEIGNAVFVPQTPWIYTCALEDSLQVWSRHSGRLVAPTINYQSQEQPAMLLTCEGTKLVIAPYEQGGISIDLTRLQPREGLNREDEHLLTEINAHGAIGQDGNYHRFSRQEWFTRWQRFRHKHPDYHDDIIDPSPKELVHWHREMALDPNRQRYGKGWHLNRWLALKDSPEAKDLLEKLGAP